MHLICAAFEAIKATVAASERKWKRDLSVFTLVVVQMVEHYNNSRILYFLLLLLLLLASAVSLVASTDLTDDIHSIHAQYCTSFTMFFVHFHYTYVLARTVVPTTTRAGSQ